MEQTFDYFRSHIANVTLHDEKIFRAAGLEIVVPLVHAYPFVMGDEKYVVGLLKGIQPAEISSLEEREVFGSAVIFSTDGKDLCRIWPPRQKISEKKGKILVIEDDEDIVDLITEVLQLHDYNVIAAGNGQSGYVEFLMDTRIDAMFVDLHMPIADGMQVLDAYCALKVPDGFVKPLLTVLTGFSTKEALLKAKDLGITSWLAKPVDYDRMLKLLENV